VCGTEGHCQGGRIADRLALQPDGRIVVAGSSGANLAVMRVNTDGTLDPAFGTAGVQTFPGWPSDVGNVLVQPDGKIIVAASSEAFVVRRLRPNGQLDPDFGNGGVATVAAGTDAYDESALLQRDGRVVVAGDTRVDGRLALAAVRLENGVQANSEPITLAPDDSRSSALDGGGDTAAPPAPICMVPKLRGLTLRIATARLHAAHCKLGAVRYARSATRRAGTIVSSSPAWKARRAHNARVRLVVARRSH
jgi:uncharacterized delta-60 repeat protein